MAGFNISSFFGGKGSGNTLFGTFNFSEYNSIRSGAYKKLLDRYYGRRIEPASTQSDKKTTVDKVKLSSDTSGLSRMRKEADELKKSAETLAKNDLWKQQDGKYDVEKIVGAVKAFAGEYNDVIDQSEKMTNRSVTQRIRTMKSLNNTMSKSLQKLGITVGDDGKMTVDETALKKADMNTVKSVFYGNYSYSTQMVSKAESINNAAAGNSGLYTDNGTYGGAVPSMYDYFI